MAPSCLLDRQHNDMRPFHVARFVVTLMAAERQQRATHVFRDCFVDALWARYPLTVPFMFSKGAQPEELGIPTVSGAG